MQKYISIIIILSFSISTFAQKDWKKKGIKIPPPICYGSGHSHKHFTPPPDDFLKRLKSTNDKKAEIVVDYVGFSDSAKTAFQYAVDIWENLIYSPVPIHMLARWSSLDEGVLGSCGPYIYFENFDAAHFKDSYYPVALVEKMEGEEITGSDIPDMIAQFNKDFDDWYFGIDGNTPAGKYDFVTIVLHEIAHGLGFTGFFFTEGEIGHYGGTLDYPGVFDEFVADSQRRLLVDTANYMNGTEDLYDALTGRILYHTSPTAQAADELNQFARLYAPSEYDEGSSTYHLNEVTYQTGNENSLMTPFADLGAATHNPGPLTLGIFADMGWQFISIKHDEIGDTENTSDPIILEATVYSDSPLDSSSVVLVYTHSSFDEESDTVQLTYNETKQLFEVDFPDLRLGENKYYLSASDVDGITYRLPGIAPERFFDFNIGPDTIKPELAHTPIRSMLETDLNAEVFVEIIENIGVAEAKIEYLINDQAVQNINLEIDSADVYKGMFSFDNLVNGDSIRYRIKVTDSSSNSNIAYLPEEEYFTFYIDGKFDDPIKEYFNDFNDLGNRDFIANEFFIGVEPKFDDGALHSPHPYPSPDQENTNFEFTALLKYPIIIKNGGKVSFKEIVLIEPGEDGAEFGDDEFWDYAIVEGSKNGEDNWLPLLDGYDSREFASWEILYNVGISGNNSSSVGTPNLYIQRDFILTDSKNFEVGDTIYMRFRIFSDPYAHGWGWAIDDLSIQDKLTSNRNFDFSPGEIQVFPNPANNELTIQGDFKNTTDLVEFGILSSAGVLVMQEKVGVVGNWFNKVIDVQSLSSGLYLVVISFENGQVITRKVVKE